MAVRAGAAAQILTTPAPSVTGAAAGARARTKPSFTSACYTLVAGALR